MLTNRHYWTRRAFAPACAALFALAALAAGCGHSATQTAAPSAAPPAISSTVAPGAPGAITPAGQVHPHNWAQRHPTATGVGAGLLTHHALKVAARNAKLHGKKLNWAERHPTLTAIGAGVATSKVIKSTTH